MFVISFNLLQNSYIILNSLINCCETLYLFDLWSWGVFSSVYVYTNWTQYFIKPEDSENAQNQICKLRNLENWAQDYAYKIYPNYWKYQKQGPSWYESFRSNRVFYKVTLSSPCLWASFDPLSPLSVVSAKQRHFIKSQYEMLKILKGTQVPGPW